jgi:hypothetical protein
MTKTETLTCVWPSCNQPHQMPALDVLSGTYGGRDALCMKCVQREHVDFMRKTGRKLGLTCLPTCECQR